MRVRVWVGRSILGLLALITAGIVMLMIYQRTSDGPTGAFGRRPVQKR